MTDDDIRWELGGLGAEHLVVEDAKERHKALLDEAQASVTAWRRRKKKGCECRADALEDAHDHPDKDEQLETAQSTLASLQRATELVGDYAADLNKRAAKAKERAVKAGVSLAQ